MRIQLQKPWTGVRYLMVFALIMLIVGASMVLAAPDKGHHRRVHVVGAKHRKKGSAKFANKAAGPSWEDVDDDVGTSKNYNVNNQNNVNDLNNVNAANDWPDYGKTAGFPTMGAQQPSTPYNTFTNQPTSNAPMGATLNSPMTNSWAGSASPGYDSKYDALLSDPFMGTAAGYQSSIPGNLANPFLSRAYQSNQNGQTLYGNLMPSGGTSNSYQSRPTGYQVFVKGMLNGIKSFIGNVIQSSPSNYQYGNLGNSLWVPNNMVQHGYNENAPLPAGVFQSTPIVKIPN